MATTPVERIVVGEGPALTIPPAVLEALGALPGDTLEMHLDDAGLHLSLAIPDELRLLRRLQHEIAASGVPEHEFFRALHQTRDDVVRELIDDARPA